MAWTYTTGILTSSGTDTSLAIAVNLSNLIFNKY